MGQRQEVFVVERGGICHQPLHHRVVLADVVTHHIQQMFWHSLVMLHR